MKKAFVIFSLIAFIFKVGAQDNTLLQKEYKDRIAEQENNYPTQIGQNNTIRKSYMDGDIHVVEIQVDHLSKAEIGKQLLLKIENQLLDTLGASFCKDGTTESAARTIGLSSEYRYFDKNAERFHTILFTQAKCDQLAMDMANVPKNTAEEIRTNMQIKALDKAGTGRVKVCELNPLNGMIKIGYSNESYKVATFYASDDYMINSTKMSLDKKKLRQLRELLLSADETAKANAMLDNLNLGKFQTNSGRLSLNSNEGTLMGNFRSKTAGGSVTLVLEATEIARCLSQVEPHLN